MNCAELEGLIALMFPILPKKLEHLPFGQKGMEQLDN